jgi:predicted neuraminidase
MKIYLVFILALTTLVQCKNQATTNDDFIQKAEFIYRSNEVPYPSCHASTIEETPDGLVAAWFGGTHEKHEDVGIWLSRFENQSWTKPVEVVNGVQNDTLRYPTWNPVLYYENNQLILFYKVGPNCADWWGKMMVSTDNGKSWSEPTRFQDDIWGPIRNKAIRLSDGRLLCPSSTENNGWRVHMEWTYDLGETWSRTPALNNGDLLSAIQPTILIHPNEKLQMLCRTRTHRIFSAWSNDKGETWTKLEATDLPNNNSGIDAVTLQDGRHLLVYNHIDRSKFQGKRNLLHVAISDDGINWEAVGMLENDQDLDHEYSYPAIIQSEDGLVHITYTWRRELIKHVVIDPDKINADPIENGIWPESKIDVESFN